MNPSREKDPGALRSDINVTRSRMDDTMDELGERMQPRHLVDELLGWFRRNSDEPEGDLRHLRDKITHSADAAMHAVVNTVKKNPVPALLIGAGIAWMMYENKREPSVKTGGDGESPPRDHNREGIRYDPDVHYDRPLQYPRGRDAADSDWSDQGGSKLGEMKDAVTGKAAAAAEQVKEKLSAAGDRTREKIGQIKERAGEISARVGERTREAYGRTRDRVATTADEHPLEVGLACLAAGVIAGLALPTPNVANRVAGRTADRLRDRARETSTEMMEKTRNVARAAVAAVKDEAKAQGLAGGSAPTGDQREPGNQSGPAARPLESRPEVAGM